MQNWFFFTVTECRYTMEKTPSKPTEDNFYHCLRYAGNMPIMSNAHSNAKMVFGYVLGESFLEAEKRLISFIENYQKN